jgi:hypothetical protein
MGWALHKPQFQQTRQVKFLLFHFHIHLLRVQIDTVVQMFPHLERHVIEADLRRTRSVDQTVDRILSNQINVRSYDAICTLSLYYTFIFFCLPPR